MDVSRYENQWLCEDSSPMEVCSTSLLRELSRRRGGMPQVVGIAGLSSRSGCTTVACGLAAIAIRDGLRPTLLIDANFCDPGLAPWFSSDRQIGFADWLIAQDALAKYLQPSRLNGLTILTAGSDAACQTANIANDAVRMILDKFSQDFRFIIVDLSVADDSSDFDALAAAMDSVVLVVAADEAGPDDIVPLQTRLNEREISLFGLVLNRCEPQRTMNADLPKNQIRKTKRTPR